jgi:hemerythrin-like domain-containing protein
MKRAPELRYLSDHHHQGLVHARRLRRAATREGSTTPKETAETLRKVWREEATAHFREEEEVLLPVLARYGGGAGRGPVAQMLAQHTQIRGLVMELSDEVRNGVVKPETLEGLGELLETHIRLEEREVFPLIEKVLPEEGLAEVASRLKVRGAESRAEP